MPSCHSTKEYISRREKEARFVVRFVFNVAGAVVQDVFGMYACQVNEHQLQSFFLLSSQTMHTVSVKAC